MVLMVGMGWGRVDKSRVSHKVPGAQIIMVVPKICNFQLIDSLSLFYVETLSDLIFEICH